MVRAILKYVVLSTLSTMLRNDLHTKHISRSQIPVSKEIQEVNPF